MKPEIFKTVGIASNAPMLSTCSEVRITNSGLASVNVLVMEPPSIEPLFIPKEFPRNKYIDKPKRNYKR